MAELSAYILAKDEAANVDSLMDSLAGVKDVVVLDNGSTDGTQELFAKRGARVFDGTRIGKHTVAQQDVEAFTERFGFAPQFAAGSVFDDSGARRNYAASLCWHDWVLNPDCDERPEWDLNKVKVQLNGQPALRHRYVHQHNPDGTPLIEFVQCKLYNRNIGRYTGRIHEVLVHKDTQKPHTVAPFTPALVLHHWQRPRDWRANHADQLEYQALKDETHRNLHYLAREYVDQGQYDRALAVYDRYFGMPSDFPEQVSQAWMARAECFRELGRTDEAIVAYHEAMALDDTRREPFFFLGQIYLARDEVRKALVYFTMANTVPYNPQGFMNDMRLYTWGVHDNISICYLRLGMQDLAQMHWLEALKHLPDGEEGARLLSNGAYIMRTNGGAQ